MISGSVRSAFIEAHLSVVETRRPPHDWGRAVRQAAFCGSFSRKYRQRKLKKT
jgi:hypothetical protein